MLSINRVQFNNKPNTLSFKSGHNEIDPYLLAATCDPNDLAIALGCGNDDNTPKNNEVEKNGIFKTLKENYKTLLGVLFDDKTTKQAKKVDESLGDIVQSGILDNPDLNILA